MGPTTQGVSLRASGLPGAVEVPGWRGQHRDRVTALAGSVHGTATGVALPGGEGQGPRPCPERKQGRGCFLLRDRDSVLVQPHAGSWLCPSASNKRRFCCSWVITPGTLPTSASPPGGREVAHALCEEAGRPSQEPHSLGLPVGLWGAELWLPESRERGSLQGGGSLAHCATFSSTRAHLPGPNVMSLPLRASAWGVARAWHCCGERVPGALLRGPTRRDRRFPLRAEGASP